MILPVGAPRFSEAMRWGVEVFHSLKSLLKKRSLSTAVGDEGGFAPDLPSNEAAIEIILVAIAQAGFKAGQDIALGLTWPVPSSAGMASTNWPQKASASTRHSSSTTSALGGHLPDRHHRGRHGRKRLGRLGTDHRPIGQRCSL